MKIILETDTTMYTVPFIPTSVYINNIQTYDYTLEDFNVYFTSTIKAGTELTFIPEDAIRFIDSGIQTLNLDLTGEYSLLADPFGKILFSTDQVVWTKTIKLVFPQTVYIKYIPLDPIIDLKCDASIELIIWQGTQMYITEEATVATTITEEVTYYV